MSPSDLFPPRLSWSAAAIAAAIGAPAAVHAAFPERPITLVVAYAPGGGTDTAARVLARGLQRALNQSIVVENKPGAGGTIGASAVMRANPDGYTLLFADPAFVINTGLMPNVGYDLKKDFLPISTITRSPLVLTVHTGLPVENLTTLVASAFKKPGGLSYSSAGIGTTPHMAGEMLKFYTKAPFTHIPFKGSGPAMSNLVAGQLDFSFSTIPPAKSFIQLNKIRAIATTGPERSRDFPDVPTVAETIPGFNVQFWTGLFAPANTPPAVIQTINEAVRKTLADPEIKALIEKTGDTPAYLSTEQVASFVNEEQKRWSSLIKEAGIKAE
ncbi:MAG: tripartite tricarboxylate transporter substrate binding protein [Pigmentiphaga sp.]|uniref:Bug family tripartite tricarboxylate transporter substrate binding protein n=1 Tax=Pigmentiphaga sp. TaxID=1977564 RepID=UPI0029A313C3|nr:tripartite tricarboxylate transporter substrate binding protein [Pigmentiphaga sp.]MDX3908041.1 tripartite tricarboxylate transporter substrate binding protein [Pigmentiphaga sp.]